MNSKNNRLNHDFQIAYFLAGSCHTPDGAYSLLCDLLEERTNALKASKAYRLREKAKRIRAATLIDLGDEAQQLEALADVAELDALLETSQKNIAACEAEIETLQKCIDRLQPLRRFAHLSDPEAHEAAQHDEWRLELVNRARNQLISTGTIDPEHLNTMRMHPAFRSEILPAIETMVAGMTKPEGRSLMLAQIAVPHFSHALIEG